MDIEHAAVMVQATRPEDFMQLPTVQLGILIGVGIVLWKVLPILVKLIEPKTTHVNGTAGEQPKEFWELEINRIAEESQRPVIEILHAQTDILRVIADSQKEMVILLKDRRMR